MKNIILLFIVTASVFIGCKKYPEGPSFSLRSAEKRLYGKYTLTKYTVDGVDSLDLYYENLGKTFEFIYDEVDDLNYCFIDGPRKDGKNEILFWVWHLINNNKILVVTKSSSYSTNHYGTFSSDIRPEWKILRLTKKETILSTNYNNKQHELVLEEN